MIVTMDGEPQGTVDCYAAPATGFQFGFIKMGLKPGVEHTLKVVVRGEMSDAQGAKGTVIRHMEFEHEADSYRASDGCVIGYSNMCPVAGVEAVRKGDVISFIAARREATREEDEAMGAMRLTVLANNGPVMVIGGNPIRIGVQKSEQGLHCHAVSKLMVRVSGPAKEFSAMVGANGPTQGSMVFIVTVDGKSVFRSGVLSAGMQAVPVHVPLDGNREFQLEVRDAGNGMSLNRSGMSLNQAAWADAEVTLADGKEVWLGDLPLRDVADQGILWDPYITCVVGEGRNP